MLPHRLESMMLAKSIKTNGVLVKKWQKKESRSKSSHSALNSAACLSA